MSQRSFKLLTVDDVGLLALLRTRSVRSGLPAGKGLLRLVHCSRARLRVKRGMQHCNVYQGFAVIHIYLLNLPVIIFINFQLKNIKGPSIILLYIYSKIIVN